MLLRAAGFSCLLIATFDAASDSSSVRRSDDATVERLREFVFPRFIEAEAKTRAFEFRDDGYAFNSLEAVKQHNLRGAHPVPNSRHAMKLAVMPLESPHRAMLREGRGADHFIQTVNAILLTEAGSRQARRHQRTVLQKMVLQRDLYQVYSLVVLARQYASARHAEIADQLNNRLARMIELTLLESDEYHELLAARPRTLPPNHTATLSYSLADNYLPLPVLGNDASWLLLTNRGKPFRHFVDYRARSFVKVYMRTADASIPHLEAMRGRMYDKYGDIMHLGAVREPVPNGLETMLVRTVGVMLVDGTFRDSFWPEEVLVRAFKYPAAKLDVTTSDFSGTVFYQYKLSRERLLHDPASLGLHRIMDDDPQFFGFFGDIPDPRNSYSNTTTTMRENCISCHAEVFYGFPTIFSMERDPDFERQKDDNDLWTELGDGAYQLKTAEFLALASSLRLRKQGRTP